MAVIWYHSEETGAPTLNNVAGSLINVLDACLINGFNSKSVTSISVTSNVATATISAHGYETGKIVRFGGATPSGLNGDKKVTVTGSNTLTFEAPGIGDDSATGTLTAVRAPLDWAKTYSGTNKAIYSRTDVAATAMMWRVDDTQAGVASATYARSIMVESATDVDTYLAASPSTAQLSGGLYMGKGVNNSTAKSWVIVGDELMVYVFLDDANSPFSNAFGLHANCFGDIVSYRAGDAYGTVVGGGNAANGLGRMFNVNAASDAPTGNDLFVARPVAQIGGSTTTGGIGGNSTGALGGSTLPAYPSPVDNGIVIQRPVLIRDVNTAFAHPIRGEIPGIAAPMGAMGTANHKRTFSNLTGFAGEMLCVTTLNQNIVGNVMIDITGPWR